VAEDDPRLTRYEMLVSQRNCDTIVEYTVTGVIRGAAALRSDVGLVEAIGQEMGGEKFL
jgi:hypothetical protein